MADNLSPDVAPTGIKVKRLNRLPLLIVFILGLSVLVAFAYLISQSGKRQHRATNGEKMAYTPSTKAAQEILAGKPKFGVIPAAAAAETNQQQTTSTSSPSRSPAPLTPRKIELTPEQKALSKIRAAKLKRFGAAVVAPTAVNNTSDFNGGSIALARAASMVGNPLANLLAARKKLQNSLGREKSDPNKQAQKMAFYMKKQPAADYLPHTRNKQRSPLEIKTGTVIPATMLGGLNSDLPGMILAQVSQNVYDTATGDYLLIPQGSRLVGTYDSAVAYGQSRALVAWTRIVYPDGSTLDLGGMPGTDQSGYAGLHDQVDRHYFRIFGSALLMSVITGAYDYSQGTSNNTGTTRTAGDTMSSAVAREMSQTSQALLRKNLNIQPTIKIRPGYKLNVMVRRDIIFPSVWK